MHVERLQRMVRLLRDDAANPRGVKFDLSVWAVPDRESERYTDADGMQGWKDDAPPTVDCGTQACAFGLAAISGEFAAEGLKATFEPVYGGYTLNPVLDEGRGASNPTHFSAAAKLFEISAEDASYFFDPGSYGNTPREAEGELLVAQRIEDFLDGDIDREYHPNTRYDDDEVEDEDDED